MSGAKSVLAGPPGAWLTWRVPALAHNMPQRRGFLSILAALPLASSVSAAFSQQRRPQREYLKVGVATALFDSGFAHHIRTVVAHSTGLAIELLPGPSGQVLALLEAGE